MTPILSEIRLFSFGDVPEGWLPCDGRLLPIQDHLALYSLLGTTYGGDGTTTFALPDLRGRVPAGVGDQQRAGVAFAFKQSDADAATHETVALNFCIAAKGVYPYQENA